MIYLHVKQSTFSSPARRDFAHPSFMDRADVAANLFEAVETAVERGGTDKIIVFDGSYGSLNVSPTMAEHLLELAPECAREVDDELLPKWLKQRWIDPLALR